MIRTLKSAVLLQLLLGASPVLAAAAEDGLGSVAPATLLFSVAIAILLTLLLRNTVTLLSERAARWFGRRRVRRCLDGMDFIEDAILPGAYGGLVRVDFAVRLPAGIACLRSVRAAGSIATDCPSPPESPVASTSSIAQTGQRPGSDEGGVHIIGQMYRVFAVPPGADADAPPSPPPSAVNHPVFWAIPSRKKQAPTTATTAND